MFVCVYVIFLTSPTLKRKNIEILKLRFGDAALQVCEVMLRDMSDSRRIDQHIQSRHQVWIPFFFSFLVLQLIWLISLPFIPLLSPQTFGHRSKLIL